MHLAFYMGKMLHRQGLNMGLFPKKLSLVRTRPWKVHCEYSQRGDRAGMGQDGGKGMAIQNKIKGTLVSALTCKELETCKDLVLITRDS